MYIEDTNVWLTSIKLNYNHILLWTEDKEKDLFCTNKDTKLISFKHEGMPMDKYSKQIAIQRVV